MPALAAAVPGRRQFLAALAATSAAAGTGGLLAACGSADAARPGAVPRKRYGGNLAACRGHGLLISG